MVILATKFHNDRMISSMLSMVSIDPSWTFDIVDWYIYSIDDCSKLQKDLDAFTMWSHQWQMSLNARLYEFVKI